MNCIMRICLHELYYLNVFVGGRSKAQILQLEQELAGYLDRHANTRTKEMIRVASDIVDQVWCSVVQCCAV